MLKAKHISVIGLALFTSMIFAQVAMADIAPPPPCKPGENPETSYCDPVVIPRNNHEEIIVPDPDPVVNPAADIDINSNGTETTNTDSGTNKEVNPEEIPLPPDPPYPDKESKIDPIIVYIAGAVAVVITGIVIGIAIKGKK